MKKFDILLSESMRVTIRRVFGESASELIYRLSEKRSFARRGEVAENVEAFQAYLQRLVGAEISQIIVASSLRKLYTALRREYVEVERYLSLLDELDEVKFRLLMSLSNDNAGPPLHN